MSSEEYPQTPPRLRNIHVVSPVYFVTCCAHDRHPLLATDRVHQAFVDFVQRGFDKKNVAVGRYVIMPDHMHLFVRGAYDFKLSLWVNQLKGFLTKQIRLSSFQDNGGRSPKATVWQRGFFDHVMRSGESYSEKWKYIEQNPVRAGLVKRAADWSYAGECVEIRF